MLPDDSGQEEECEAQDSVSSSGKRRLVCGPSMALSCRLQERCETERAAHVVRGSGAPVAGEARGRGVTTRGWMNEPWSQALCPHPPTAFCGDACEVMARTEAVLGPVTSRPSLGSSPRDGALTGVTRAELIEAEKAESASVGSSCRLHQSR